MAERTPLSPYTRSVTVTSDQSQVSDSHLTQHTPSSRSARSPTISTQSSVTQSTVEPKTSEPVSLAIDEDGKYCCLYSCNHVVHMYCGVSRIHDDCILYV